MIINYIPNDDKKNISLVGSFIIKINNKLKGGTKICMDYNAVENNQTYTPVQTYNHILSNIYSNNDLRNQLSDYMTNQIHNQPGNYQALTGDVNSRLTAQVQAYTDNNSLKTIVINFIKYELQNNIPMLGQRYAHNTLHFATNTASARVGQPGPSHSQNEPLQSQNEPLQRKTVIGLRWRLCAQYDCNVIPVTSDNVHFDLNYDTVVSRNPSITQAMYQNLADLASFMADFIIDQYRGNRLLHSNPLNLDSRTTQYLIARINDVCNDYNTDIQIKINNPRPETYGRRGTIPTNIARSRIWKIEENPP
jgi:hypothetical protein